jgi:hypothetical protein
LTDAVRCRELKGRTPGLSVDFARGPSATMVGVDAAGLPPNAKFGVGASSVSRALVASESLWTTADDRLPGASLGRVQRGDSIVEGRDVADVGPQSSVPHPLDDRTQLGTIGLDNEIGCQAVGGPRLGRPYDAHQGSSGPDQACGPPLDVSADDIEHWVDAADVFQGIVVEVDELLRAEVQRLLVDRALSRGYVLLPLCGTSPPPGGAGLSLALRHGTSNTLALSRRRSRQHQDVL